MSTLLEEIPALEIQQESIYVVSDKFKEFSEKKNVVTYSELLAGLKQRRVSARKYIIGQGINMNQLVRLRQQLQHSQQTYEVDEKISLKIKAEYVHKHHEQNVLITYPDQIGEYEFLVFLVIDENSSEMTDHITGAHIPGVLLIEASRQTFMASFEALCLQEYAHSNGYLPPLANSYILKDFRIQYLSFLFPTQVEATLNFSHIEWDKKKKTAIGTVKIIFSQNGHVACEAECTGCAFPKPFVASIEKRQLRGLYRELNGNLSLANTEVRA